MRWGKPEIVYLVRAGARCVRRWGSVTGTSRLTDEAGLVVAVAVLMRRAQQ